ncbi:MAG: hypothetical protein N4A76_13360 [Firmicutes bacterium]|jgi:spore coat polysaccharide biosynthesis protein SpsF (cytidylyltransferase family)|nr:hypothetical protein [Bacillota bacterium]
MNTRELKKWVVDNKIGEKIREDFSLSIENNEDLAFEGEGTKGIEKENVSISIDSISVKIKDWNLTDEKEDLENEFIEVNCTMLSEDNKIAEYRTLYNFSGELIDDFIVFDNVYETMRKKIKGEVLSEVIEVLANNKVEEKLLNEIKGMRD